MPRSKRSKVKRSRDEVRTLMPTRVDDRGRDEQRSMRLNDAFDNFRREIEGATNPWSSMLDLRFPRPYAMDEEGTLSRTPLVAWLTEETDTISA